MRQKHGLCAAQKKNFVGFCPMRIKSAAKGNNSVMIKPTQNLQAIKDNIRSFYDTDVDVRVNLGRNKIVQFTGRLSGVYPALFTVAPHDKNYRGKTAYSYSEIICGSVRIKPHH